MHVLCKSRQWVNEDVFSKIRVTGNTQLNEMMENDSKTIKYE